MQAFYNHAKLNTSAILRYDALMAFFKKLDHRAQLEYQNRLEASGYTEENVALNVEAATASEQLEKLLAERHDIVTFNAKLVKAMNGDMSF